MLKGEWMGGGSDERRVLKGEWMGWIRRAKGVKRGVDGVDQTSEGC